MTEAESTSLKLEDLDDAWTDSPPDVQAAPVASPIPGPVSERKPTLIGIAPPSVPPPPMFAAPPESDPAPMAPSPPSRRERARRPQLSAAERSDRRREQKRAKSEAAAGKRAAAEARQKKKQERSEAKPEPVLAPKKAEKKARKAQAAAEAEAQPKRPAVGLTPVRVSDTAEEAAEKKAAPMLAQQTRWLVVGAVAIVVILAAVFYLRG